MKPYPPLGLLYLAAYLQREGVEAEVFDTTFATRGDLLARLDEAPGVIGVYTNLMTRAIVLWIFAEAKQRGWTVIAGGPESANYPDEYLAHGADVVVIGEGEVTTHEVLAAIERVGVHDLHGVDGIAFRDGDGRVVRTPDRAKVADLDSLPWPARDAIDTARYVDVWRTHHGMGSVNLITARGCPYKCNWCSHAVYGYSHRRRSAAGTADEVAHIMERYQPDQVWYADDVFTFSHRWLYDYAGQLKQRGLRVPFETISRADRMQNDKVLETLAEMGCYRIWIGSESGSQRILDAMQRGVTVEEVQWATDAAKRHGIEVGMFLMWGYDGETIDDIEATIDHVAACDPNVFFTTVAYPIKNTGYYEKVGRRIKVTGDWAERTDRDVRIAGRHSRRYYTAADAWLRHHVESVRLASADPAAAATHRADAAQARADLLAWADEVEEELEPSAP